MLFEPAQDLPETAPIREKHDPFPDTAQVDFTQLGHSLFAETDDPSDPLRGEHALWRAVITQALMDAGNRSHKAEAARDRKTALRWLTCKSIDFEIVCDHAGLIAADARTKIKRALARGCQWRAAPGSKRKKTGQCKKDVSSPTGSCSRRKS